MQIRQTTTPACSTSPLSFQRQDALHDAQLCQSTEATGRSLVGLVTPASGLKNVVTAQQTVAIYSRPSPG